MKRIITFLAAVAMSASIINPVIAQQKETVQQYKTEFSFEETVKDCDKGWKHFLKTGDRALYNQLVLKRVNPQEQAAMRYVCAAYMYGYIEGKKGIV
jgi:hypothetical protein